MTDNYLLQGKINWSFSHELAEISDNYKVTNSMLSFAAPLHSHVGLIALSETELIIEGTEDDLDLTINLSAIKQIFLGFDKLYPVTAVKSFGAFWQPIRIEYFTTIATTDVVYLIIDYNGVFTNNKQWFKLLINLLE